jgi:DNA-binding SARP family transcriptional activator
VALDGGFPPAELLWRKHVALLVYLARSPRRGRTREHLVGLLWADKPESAARHSLNEAVRLLRRAAGDATVETSATQVRLTADTVRLDLDQIEAHVARGDWCAAAALVAGEFMEGFSVAGASAFEEWLAAERTDWRRRGVEILARYAESLLAAGRTAEVVTVAERALRLDPHSDVAARVLIRSLALSGQRAAALDRYAKFAQQVAEELGVAPEPETVLLVERVKRDPTVQRPRPHSRGDDSEPTARLPLVGREAELGRLLDLAGACVRERRATLLVLDGDAGTGKTRLLEELLARVRLEGAAVAAIRAVEADRDEPWSGVRALARGGLLGVRGLAGAPAGALAAFAAELPEWAERFPAVVRETALGPGRALGELLRAALDEQPIFLAADDAEWLDRESLLALTSTLRDLAATPHCVVLTTSARRAQLELDELRSRIGRDLTGLVVSLGPFDVAGLRALARHVLPSFDEVEIDRVVRRVGTDSAGLPLLAVELLRAVAVGMDLGATSGAWPEPLKTLDQTLPGELPDAVVSAIRVGYRRLGTSAQRVLAAAAILDDRLTAEMLARAADLPIDEVTTALDELEWQRWMVSEPRGYGFTARLVRQFIGEDMLTQGQRRRILERAGRSAAPS